MYLDELLDKDYTPEQMARIIYSFAEHKDIDVKKFLAGDRLMNKLIVEIMVKKNHDYNYYNLVSQDHHTKKQILFPTGEFKTISNSNRIIRTATSNSNGATMVSTILNNTRTDSNIMLNNRIILPGNEVSLNTDDFELNSHLNPKQSSILVRNIETSGINSISNNIHQNSYKQFNPEEFELAKKYFTFNDSNTIPAPSFQFSYQQNNKIYTNSIHIDKLIQYLEDLVNSFLRNVTQEIKNEELQYYPILHYDLGMPFKQILTKDIVVRNEPISEFVKSMNDLTTRDCMYELKQETFPVKHTRNSGGQSLNVIYNALRKFKKFINDNPDDVKSIVRMTQCLNTILNTSLASNYAPLQDESIKIGRS